MPEEPAVLSSQAAAGWAAIGALVVASLILYFMYGRSLPPLTAEPPAPQAAVP